MHRLLCVLFLASFLLVGCTTKGNIPENVEGTSTSNETNITDEVTSLETPETTTIKKGYYESVKSEDDKRILFLQNGKIEVIDNESIGFLIGGSYKVEGEQLIVSLDGMTDSLVFNIHEDVLQYTGDENEYLKDHTTFNYIGERERSK